MAMTIDLDAYLCTKHLPPIARKIMADHDLVLKEAPNIKAVWRRALEPAFSQGRNGYAYRIQEYMKAHRQRLDEDYPLLRSYWPSAFSWFVQIHEDQPIAFDDEFPWAATFLTIIGDPYPDWPFKPELWRAVVHQQWTDNSQKLRYDWIRQFYKDYPDSGKYEIFSGETPQDWQQWRVAAFANGIGTVKGLWEHNALLDLNLAQTNAIMLSA